MRPAQFARKHWRNQIQLQCWCGQKSKWTRTSTERVQWMKDHDIVHASNNAGVQLKLV